MVFSDKEIYALFANCIFSDVFKESCTKVFDEQDFSSIFKNIEHVLKEENLEAITKCLAAKLGVFCQTNGIVHMEQ